MPAIIRCKLCGTDHPYREDVQKRPCENCGVRLSLDNAKVIIQPRITEQADPLGGM